MSARPGIERLKDMEGEIYWITRLHKISGCVETKYCEHSIKQHQKLMERYAEFIFAVIPLTSYESFDEYVRISKRLHNGNHVRNAAKARRLGYTAKIFMPVGHEREFFDINHSMPTRRDRPMRGWYRSNVEELEKSFRKWDWPEVAKCPFHFTVHWGVFDSQDKLVGYIKINSNGNYALYHKILGHGDHLKSGIIYFLHFEIVRWLMENYPHIEYLTYGGFTKKTVHGLGMWKKNTLFQPALLKEGDNK